MIIGSYEQAIEDTVTGCMVPHDEQRTKRGIFFPGETGLEDQREQQHVLFPPGVEQLLGRIHISERFRKAPGCFSTRDSRPMNWMTEGEIENYEA